jgi:hypothetical protein
MTKESDNIKIQSIINRFDERITNLEINIKLN